VRRCQSRTKSDTNLGPDAFGISDRYVTDLAANGNARAVDADHGLFDVAGIVNALATTARPMRKKRLIAAGGLALAGMLSVAHGAWIPAKAKLAQILLEDAWQKTQLTQRPTKPWPWADTWPVGRLSAPAQNQSLIVLAGASGEALAFGPGHLSQSATPGSEGNSVIAGHRDTHFAFLKHLKSGDRLQLEAQDGKIHEYQVTDLRVVLETETEVLLPTEQAMLTLITCYPFDALKPGGPLRYVVRAARLR
jgi:sortase A